jgi:hypothetical protein
MQLRLALLLALLVLVTACGSSDNKSSSSVSTSTSGNWQMSLQKSNTSLTPKTQSGFLVQTNDAISGSMIFIDAPCSGVGNVNGTVTGSAVTLNVDSTGLAVILAGTIASGQTSMSGNYTILSTGCSGSSSAPQMGTFTANMVSPLSGNITGTFLSSSGATTYAVTGQVTQGANAGDSTTPLAGTLSFTGFCYASANIVGSISGTSVVMNLVNANGGQIGQVTGTSSLDGTLLSGKYQYLGLGKGAAKGCTSSGSGTFTFSL